MNGQTYAVAENENQQNYEKHSNNRVTCMTPIFAGIIRGVYVARLLRFLHDFVDFHISTQHMFGQSVLQFQRMAWHYVKTV